MKAAFPVLFPEAADRAEVLRSYLLCHIDELLTPDDPIAQKQAGRWYALLWEQNQPEVLHPAEPDNAVAAIRRDYEGWYASLRDQGIDRPETLTIYRFFAQVDFVRQKIDAYKP